MKKQCEAAIKAAAGRELSKVELDSIDERMRAAVRELSKKDNAKFMAMTPDERLKEAAKIAKEWMLKDVVRSHEQTIQEGARKTELFRSVRSVKPGLKGQILYLKDRILAAERRAEAWKKLFMRLAEGSKRADKGKFLGLVADPKAQFEIVKAIWGDTSVSPEAKAFADNLNKMLDAVADTFQRNGLTLNKMDDYRTPQPQDASKLAGNKAKWLSDHMTWVDRSKYINADGTMMNDAQLKRFLEEVYDTLLTDGANKRASDDRPSGGSMLVGANKNKPRRLFYKSADAWNAAMQNYGRSTNLYENIMSHVHSMSKDIAMAEVFGRNAEKNFRQALGIAEENDLKTASGDKQHNKITALGKRTSHLFDAYTTPNPVVNPMMANIGENIRGYLSSVMLGGGPWSSAPDLANIKVYSEMYNLPQFQTFRQIVKTMPSAERDDFAQRLGLWFSGFQDAHNRMARENFSNGWGTFLSSATNRLMFQDAMDRGNIIGFGMVMQNTLGKFTRKHATLAAAEGDTKLLRDMGVNDDIWNVWRTADLVEGYGADSLLSPQAIYDIPDAKLAPIVEQRVKARSEALKAEIDKRDAQTEREKGWLESRMEKFDAARKKAYNWMREYDARRQKMVGEAADMAAANAELLRARLERAEVEHDIAGYLKTETSQARIKRFLERVEDGANVERQNNEKTPAIGERAKKAVEDYGRSINKAAESLGQRRARTEARIEAAVKRLDEMSKKADAEVQRKAKELDKRFGATLKEIEETAAEYKARAIKRAEYAEAFEAKIGKVLGEEMMKAKDEAAAKLLEVVYYHSRRAVRGASAANIEDRAAFGLTRYPAGTFIGEVARFALQFKTVPLGVFRTQLEIVLGMEASAGTKMAFAAKFVAYATLMAALGLQIKSLLSGQDPADMDLSTEEGQKFWIKAIASGGGFGIYGDLLANSETIYGRGPLETILGPGVGLGVDAVETTFNSKGLRQMVGDAYEGETDRNYGLEALQFARRNAMPFANIWYVRGAFNRLVYDQLQETLEPGTIDRHRKRMEDRGASYWWEPGELSPDRAPDLSKAYEE